MIPALVLLFAAVGYRILAGLLIQSGTTSICNFAPLAAIALCGAVYLPRRYKFAVPLIALFISDVILNVRYHAPLLDPRVVCHYLAFTAVGCLGLLLQHRPSWKLLLPASIAGSTIFYVITNVFSWLADPGYTKNFVGLVQALTVGLPQYSATPTWMFFRNSLVGDLFFTALFVACMHFSRSANRSRQEATVPRPA
jgi:hypothetical protein